MKMNGVRIMLFFIVALTGVAGRRAAASEPSDVNRRESVRRALAWLVKTLENNNRDKRSSGKKEEDKEQRKVATLTTAWLLEANPDFSEFDQAVRSRFRGRADRFCKIDTPTSCNWLQGFAALYAYERSLRDGKPHPALDSIARGFIDRQNKNGGWCHSIGIPAPYYATTMVVTTNLALFALGAAKREGMAVCKEESYKNAVSKTLKLLNKLQAPDGAMPYGHGGGTLDFGNGNVARVALAYHPARTAAMLAALAVVDQTDGELFRRAGLYVGRNFEAIPKAAESVALNLALGGLGCYILSDDVWKLYESKLLDRLQKEQCQDGSFKPTVLGGPAYDTAYTTALCAVALNVDRTEVARHLRKSTSSKRKK
jgi:hypothetical protein